MRSQINRSDSINEGSRVTSIPRLGAPQDTTDHICASPSLRSHHPEIKVTRIHYEST